MSLPFSGKQAGIAEHRPAKLVGGPIPTAEQTGGSGNKLAQNGSVKKKGLKVLKDEDP